MLAILQLRATADVVQNISQAVSLVRRAATHHKANFICLPEAFDYILDPLHASPLCIPEPLDGHRVRTFSALAKELNVWISLGGFHERAPNDDTHQQQQQHYNTHLILDNQGHIQATYRKIHLFDASVEHGFRESLYTLPGHELVLCRNTPIGTVGLTTCYDVRFPKMYQDLRDMGCDVVLVPAAFTETTGKAGHWHTLLRARAIENQVYIAAAAQVGRNHSQRTSFGHSMGVDPFGQVLVDLELNENAIGVFEIVPSRIASVRENMPVQMHRFKAKI